MGGDDRLAEAAQEPIEGVGSPHANGADVGEVDDAGGRPGLIGGEPDPVAGYEAAGNGAQHDAASGAGFDEELVGDEAAIRRLAAAVAEPPGRVPGADIQLWGVLAEDCAHRAALAWLNLVLAHEPRVDPRAGGDRRPVPGLARYQ